MASIPLGHSEPKTKLKLITGAQHSMSLSGKVGLAGGKPTITISPTASKSTSTTTELADDEVCLQVLGSQGSLIAHSLHQVAEQWLVSPQQIDDNWEDHMFCYRKIETKIHRRHLEAYQVPAHLQAINMKTKYGMAVEVRKSIGKVSLIFHWLSVMWNAQTELHRTHLKCPFFTGTKFTAGWQLGPRPGSEA